MVALRGTEKLLLNKKFGELAAIAFQHLTQQVTVYNITDVHPLLHVPIVSMKNNGVDVFGFLQEKCEKNGFYQFTSLLNPSSSFTLTPAQQEVMKSLEKKGHVSCQSSQGVVKH